MALKVGISQRSPEGEAGARAWKVETGGQRAARNSIPALQNPNTQPISLAPHPRGVSRQRNPTHTQMRTRTPGLRVGRILWVKPVPPSFLAQMEFNIPTSQGNKWSLRGYTNPLPSVVLLSVGPQDKPKGLGLPPQTRLLRSGVTPSPGEEEGELF